MIVRQIDKLTLELGKARCSQGLALLEREKLLLSSINLIYLLLMSICCAVIRKIYVVT